ncbi:MAG TPA: DUF924 family protein [Gammaproteobacteria bacterium]
MIADANADAGEVLAFWFGDAAAGDAAELKAAFGRWFGGGEAFDRQIEDRFGERIECALAGGFSDWADEPRSRLALILLLDQFPRNVFRGTGRAFAGDKRALALASDAVARDMHLALAPVERVFLFMPYQHAEDAGIQRQSVELYAALAREQVSPEVHAFLESTRDYAVRHCEIVARFGRFPYRNEALGRKTSAAEHAWLAESNERFGQ